MTDNGPQIELNDTRGLCPDGPQARPQPATEKACT